MNANATQEVKMFSFNGRALFAGTLFAMAITAILNLLGMGAGFTVLIHASTGEMIGTGVLGFVWLLLSSAIATFLGAWLAGFLSERTINANVQGMIQGLLVWAATTLIILGLLTSSVGTFLSGSSRILRNISITHQMKWETNISNVSNEIFTQLRNSIQDKLKNSNIKPENLNVTLERIRDFLAASDEQKKQELEKRISIALAENTNMSLEESNQFITQLKESYDELAQKMKEKVEKVSKEISKGLSTLLLSLFFINIVSAIAAVWGGKMGSNRNIPLQNIMGEENRVEKRDYV